MHPVCLAVATLSLLLVGACRFRRKVSRFPGPTQLPWLGRVHDLPIRFMWLKLKEWADEYGPIYYTEMLGAKVLVVTDEKIAEELLVKRAKFNSDRPAVRSLFDSKSTDGSMSYLPLMGKNKYWARQRRWTHASLTEAANLQYYDIITFEVKRWLFRLLVEPDAFYDTIDDLASKVMCTLTWDDPDLSETNTKLAWGLLTQMSPAGPLTNVLTPLWHLPLWVNPWKRAELQRQALQDGWWDQRLQESRSKLRQGRLRHCWTRQYLENAKLSGDREAASCIGMLALVGVFTIAAPAKYFLMAMVHHPHWLMRVQAELDRVCGDRLLTLEDSPALPTLRACIKETMRWKPNVPSGVAHETEADDYYGDCFIPKGTRILPLDWAFLRNPAKYPDPDSFRPERWLESGWPTYEAPLTQFPTLKGMSSFGWGQRACLGQMLTQDELLLTCGATCWAFNLKFKVRNGARVPVPLNKSNSLLIIKPDPFEMEFEPRSPARARLVESNWRTAEETDRRMRLAVAGGGVGVGIGGRG